MSDPFVAEIRIFPFNFAPTGWAACDGQLLPISQNTALFSLLGTNFGGDGRSTFGLPNLEGSSPLGYGNGPGLTPRVLGESGGAQTVTLLSTEMPAHTHAAMSNPIAGVVNSPGTAIWGIPHLGKTGINAYSTDTVHNVAMNASALAASGGNQPHNNMSPFVVLNFCIALQGVFPARP